MRLNLRQFFQASNPSKTLNLSDPKDRQYYIDFSSVRGGKIIEQLKRTITRLSPEEPTCQLFTGHIGSGKSTELLRLKKELDEEGFHVIYFESSKYLDMADVDITDILLSVASQVSESLEKLKFELELKGFKTLLKGLVEVLQNQIDLTQELNLKALEMGEETLVSSFSLSMIINTISSKVKDAPNLRSLRRQYLEPRTNLILEYINQELIEPAITELKKQGQQGLVVIIDNLDRIDRSLKPTGRLQPEYLFIDRGEQLKKLNCHLLYTIPLTLVFSQDLGQLTSRFGVDPKVLPMIPVKFRDGTDCQAGLELLRKMVLIRAFPDLAHVTPEEYLNRITTVFDTPETLDRLCLMSGGHVRSLLQLLYSCLQKEDPPINRATLDHVIHQRRHQFMLVINQEEWELLHQVVQTKMVSGDIKYQTLLRNLWVFEYRYGENYWYDLNPILADKLPEKN